MEVPRERIEEILALYELRYQYLGSVNLDGEHAMGQFRLSGTSYTSVPLTHMTVIETQFCLNQLSYVSFGEWIDQGKYGLQMPREEFLKMMKENMFITDSHIRFRKLISTEDAINGTMFVRRWRKRGNLYIVNVDFEFQEGNADGTLQLALKQ